eukprot:Mrub_07787.p3 GENE.Mrub_07787~~Mrub_07787.p3  ORF type:complete len:127 (-),score=8.38 Mrub_07787:125-505(-)
MLLEIQQNLNLKILKTYYSIFILFLQPKNTNLVLLIKLMFFRLFFNMLFLMFVKYPVEEIYLKNVRGELRPENNNFQVKIPIDLLLKFIGGFIIVYFLIQLLTFAIFNQRTFEKIKKNKKMKKIKI